jgi:hypothetical protein
MRTVAICRPTAAAAAAAVAVKRDHCPAACSVRPHTTTGPQHFHHPPPASTTSPSRLDMRSSASFTAAPQPTALRHCCLLQQLAHSTTSSTQPCCNTRAAALHSNSWRATAAGGAAVAAPQRAGRRLRRQQRCVHTAAWFQQQPARTLWGETLASAHRAVTAVSVQSSAQPTNPPASPRCPPHQQQRTLSPPDYDGSAVKQLTLQEVQLLHRLSFGHRNQRSYLIVVYQADSPACQALEAEVGVLSWALHSGGGCLTHSSSTADTWVANNATAAPAAAGGAARGWPAPRARLCGGRARGVQQGGCRIRQHAAGYQPRARGAAVPRGGTRLPQVPW